MCTGYERGLKIYYKEKEKINEEFWYINVGPNVKSKIP